MSIARKRRRYVRWLRYANAIDYRLGRARGLAGAGTALYRVAPDRQLDLWMLMS